MYTDSGTTVDISKVRLSIESMTSRTLEIWVWLRGTPVFSLSYNGSETSDSEYLTDISGYRPDPRDVLEPKTKYRVIGIFDRETNYNGDDIWILRRFIMPDGSKFAYTR